MPTVTKTVCATGGADYQTLAAAVAGAPSGARLEICAGTFRENLVVDSKELHFHGAGMGSTVIDAGGAGPGIVVRAAPGSGVALEALTIKGGSGGGVRCETSGLHLIASALETNRGSGLAATRCALAISASRFEGNEGGERGGGAYLIESSGEITGTLFTNNHASYGGAISLEAGSVTLRKNELRGNHANVHGGGLHSQSDGLVEENLVVGNSAGRKGGGLYFNLHSPIIRKNTVSENTCIEDGSGIFVGAGSALVVENTMTGNRTEDDGGGLRLLSSQSRVERNMIVGNHAMGTGGGIKVSHGQATLVDNVIQGNESEGSGGGIEMDNDASIVRGGLISGNHAAWRGGGIHGSLFPFRGSTIADVVITGNRTGYGGGILLEDNFFATTLEGLTVTANQARVGGALYFSRAEFTITHSVLAGNHASQQGGGMTIGRREDWKGPWIDVCPCPPAQTPGRAAFLSVYGNDAPEGAGLWTDSPVWALENSIISGNTGGASVQIVGAPIDPPPPPPMEPAPMVTAEEPPPPMAEPDPPEWHYNNVFPATFVGMSDPTGQDGNLSGDPRYMNPVSGDFHLAPGSMCVDAGDPADTDMDGSRADMGRFGGDLAP